MNKEQTFFPILLTLLGLSIIGLPYIRYGIYSAVFFGFLVYLISGNLKLNISRTIFPMLLLITASVFNIYEADYNWVKQLYLILSYTIMFIMFDFYKVKEKFYILNLVFIFAFVFQIIISGNLSIGTLTDISLADSKAAFESTLAFPIGLLLIYSLYTKKYSLFWLNLIFVVLAFKRIVLLGVLIAILAYFIPKKIKNIFLNPYLITVFIVIALSIQVEVASGAYDKLVNQELGMSVNHLLMGRQALWNNILVYSDFEYSSFLFWGIGHSGVTSALKDIYHGRDILLHSEFLKILLENGYLILIAFSFLLTNVKGEIHKILSLFLVLLLSSDNVLIYHHVMITYLMLMAFSDETKQAVKKNTGT
jgi:hypothetical protein